MRKFTFFLQFAGAFVFLDHRVHLIQCKLVKRKIHFPYFSFLIFLLKYIWGLNLNFSFFFSAVRHQFGVLPSAGPFVRRRRNVRPQCDGVPEVGVGGTIRRVDHAEGGGWGGGKGGEAGMISKLQTSKKFKNFKKIYIHDLRTHFSNFPKKSILIFKIKKWPDKKIDFPGGGIRLEFEPSHFSCQTPPLNYP